MRQDEPRDDGVDVEVRIRARLRARRKERGLSLDALGRQAGMSASLLSRLESGARRLSIDHLAVLARALEVSVDELLVDPAPTDPRIQAVAHTADDGTTYWALSTSTVPGSPRAFKVRMRRTEAEPRVHPGRDWVYVLSGRLRLRLADHEHVLGPGEAAEFTTDQPHALSAVDGPVELLTLFGPAGEGVHLHPTTPEDGAGSC